MSLASYRAAPPRVMNCGPLSLGCHSWILASLADRSRGRTTGTGLDNTRKIDSRCPIVARIRGACTCSLSLIFWRARLTKRPRFGAISAATRIGDAAVSRGMTKVPPITVRPTPQPAPPNPRPQSRTPRHESLTTADDAPPELTEQAFKSAPPFLISMFVHMLLMVAMALITYGTATSSQLQLQAVYAESFGKQLLDDKLQSPGALEAMLEVPAFSSDLIPRS